MTVADLITELQRFPQHATVAALVPVATMDGLAVDEEICEVESVSQSNWGKTVAELMIDTRHL